MVAIVDYGMGNLRSVAKALEYLGEEVIVSNQKEDLILANKLVLPGVGSFIDGMNNLSRLSLDSFLKEEVLKNKKPLLGICLGMQLLATFGNEGGRTQGLGLIPAEVIQLNVRQFDLRLPHTGWNDISCKRSHPLFAGIDKDMDFYFVHSYHMLCEDVNNVVATCEYGVEFSAAVGYSNIFATQFHPEKSQRNGLRLLRNFLEWEGN